MFVESFVIVTVAFARYAPLASITTPRTCAVYDAWPNAGAIATAHKKITASRKFRRARRDRAGMGNPPSLGTRCVLASPSPGMIAYISFCYDSYLLVVLS